MTERIRVLIDGQPVALTNRRALMIRQLIERGEAIDRSEFGNVTFDYTRTKVQLRVTESFPQVQIDQPAD